MCDTEIMPKPHQLLLDNSGVMRWNPLFDSIAIDVRPQGGKLISITVKSESVSEFDLTAEQVSHLVALLLAPSSA